ncbi:hypothetical protein CTDIVETGP_2317 [Clostridium tyrobutyricum DIVETGP]|uniref:Uncharacterized protein n=1 Tax=Clostridium tyrobutyricum DIVETGP TaxID=1408889 RepID=W6NK16_CLOTY|nr:hypothetical protein CTDIVETGP_2317 [Clostridium tyrobutyricum DIVETGP]
MRAILYNIKNRYLISILKISSINTHTSLTNIQVVFVYRKFNYMLESLSKFINMF